jgi:hypothetical protein
MQRLAVRFTCCAKAGTENNPAQLATDTAPAAVMPVRNFRRWKTWSGCPQSEPVKPVWDSGSFMRQWFT